MEAWKYDGSVPRSRYTGDMVAMLSAERQLEIPAARCARSPCRPACLRGPAFPRPSMGALFAFLAVLVFPASATVHEVPLMRAAGGFQQGFVRVEAFEVGGEVKVEAWDDSGVHAETALRLRPGSIQAFNSDDLQSGNAAKGLTAGIGSPTVGDWRLRLSAGFDFDVNAYVRTSDGFVTSLDSTLKATSATVAEIAFFNPASNQDQRSWLRIINDASMAAGVTVRGVDDVGTRGREAYTVSVPPLNAVSVNAQVLEEAFGDGSGKWRLRVSSNRPVKIVSFLESPTGHVTSLHPSEEIPDCRPHGHGHSLGVYLGGAEHRGIDRSGLDQARTLWLYADLSGADFEGSRLYDSRFYRANVRFVNFSGADLRYASFNGADLTGADLSFSTLGRSKFWWANMTRANLSGVKRDGSSEFVFAALCNADITEAILSYSDFTQANLSGASGWRVNLSNAKLQYANMSSMYLNGADMRSANLYGADLTGSDLTESDLERADLSNASLVQARLSESNLERARLSSADLWYATAQNADFQSADLTGAILYRANLTGADLSKSDLSWGNLVEAILQDADLRETNLYRTNLINADLRNANLRDVNFCDAWSTEGINIDGAKVEGAQCLPE